jgi:hypothetical protein
MFHKILMGFVAALSVVFLAADSPPVIELKPGMNEVTLKVFNNCNSDFESIHVVIKPEVLPEGFTISPTPQHLNVSAKSQSETGLLLLIKVTEQVRPGSYEIPLLLKDKANHSWKYTFTAEVGVNKPDKYDLAQNYPNPFNITTQIKYALANDQEQQTKLIIFDLLGKQTKTLVNKKQPAGFYQVNWDGSDESGASVASGVYFYKLSSGSFVSSKKLTVLK